MRQVAKLHTEPKTTVYSLWRQKKSEQNKWGKGGWVAFCWELDAILQVLVQRQCAYCYTPRFLYSPGMSRKFYESRYEITALIWRNFYLKKEMGRISSHILCTTVVKYIEVSILLTSHTVCMNFNSLYPDATKSVIWNNLTHELSVKFKRKITFDILVLLQQQIITANFWHISLKAYYFTLHALLKELNRAVWESGQLFLWCLREMLSSLRLSNLNNIPHTVDTDPK